MTSRIFFILLVLVSVSSQEAFATHAAVGSASGTAGPVTTMSAGTLPRGSFSASLQSETVQFDTFSEDRLVSYAERGKEVHTADYLGACSLSLAYGLTHSTMFVLSMPHLTRDDIAESEPPDEAHRHGDSRGFGDLTLMLHQRVYQSEARDFLLTVLAGIKMPTGRTSDRDNHGDVFEAEFQPGSGSWDPMIGVALTRRFGDLSLDANLLYTLVTEGTQDTDLGDRFAYNLAASYRIIREPAFQVDLIAEFNGMSIAKEKVRGRKDPDSGGTVIFFSPGLRISSSTGISLYGSFGVPIAQDWNGIQNEIDYRTVFGISFSF